ncbi:serine acetyltransferase [Nocardiaceae bacterium NPDC056970]
MSMMRRDVLQDWDVNRGRPHIQIVLVLLRLSQAIRSKSGFPARVSSLFICALYRVAALGFCGIDIPVSTRIGPKLSIHHGIGLVVHNKTVIGSSVTLRQNTTIGSKDGSLPPCIGDNVSIGPNSCLIGPLQVGDRATIGAGSVVVKDVEEATVVAGNPARPLTKN